MDKRRTNAASPNPGRNGVKRDDDKKAADVKEAAHTCLGASGLLGGNCDWKEKYRLRILKDKAENFRENEEGKLTDLVFSDWEQAGEESGHLVRNLQGEQRTKTITEEGVAAT